MNSRSSPSWGKYLACGDKAFLLGFIVSKPSHHGSKTQGRDSFELPRGAAGGESEEPEAGAGVISGI